MQDKTGKLGFRCSTCGGAGEVPHPDAGNAESEDSTVPCGDCGGAGWIASGAPRFRVGSHYRIHIYEGEIPVATAMTVEYANMIVNALNAPQASTEGDGMAKAPRTETEGSKEAERPEFSGELEVGIEEG